MTEEKKSPTSDQETIETPGKINQEQPQETPPEPVSTIEEVEGGEKPKKHRIIYLKRVKKRCQ